MEWEILFLIKYSGRGRGFAGVDALGTEDGLQGPYTLGGNNLYKRSKLEYEEFLKKNFIGGG